MPILPASATPADLTRAAREQDARAEEREVEVARLALALFALERAAILRALDQARTDAEVRRALAAVRDAYASPRGLFRQEWERELGRLARAAYREEARRVRRETARVTGAPVPAPTPAQSARLDRAATERANTAARDICETSAARVEAIADAVAPLPRPNATDRARDALADISASPGPPGGGPPPRGPAAGAPTPRQRVIQQRIDTLAPILGREAAEQIVGRVAATLDAGKPTRAVARSLAEGVTAVPVSRKRAVVIARTESVGLLASAEWDAVRTAGQLSRKRWLDNRDDRVRDSHRRCAAQGIIPIDQPFVNGLQHVGQRPAPAEEVINCRCGMGYLP